MAGELKLPPVLSEKINFTAFTPPTTDVLALGEGVGVLRDEAVAPTVAVEPAMHP